MTNERDEITISRKLAFESLQEIETGKYAEEVLLSKLSRKKISAEDRSLTTEIVYGVVRWKKRLDSLIDGRVENKRKTLRPEIRNILRMAFYQLLFLDRIPDHSVVHEAVAMAKTLFGGRFSGLVNAILRSALRDPQNMNSSPEKNAKSLSVYYSHPEWLVKRWVKEFGAELAEHILEFNNQRANLTIRVNTIKASINKVISGFRQNAIGFDFIDIGPDALILKHTQRPVSDLPGFKEGFFTVQDFASQMIAPLLQPLPGHEILDLCGAPGGKSSHIAALASNHARITLVDLNEKRIDEAKKNFKRLGINCVKMIQGDSTEPSFINSLGQFDRILIDAPCSNLGVLRHNCDVKYRLSSRDLGKFAGKQLRMLSGSSHILKKNGSVIYCVCSTSKEETFDVIEKFLASHKNFVIDPIEPSSVCYSEYLTPGGCFFSFPPLKHALLDGFFAARLKVIAN
ncbi:MAG: 16S rRNA (cytosine(967)-C(5))-methyltransferase RsmB [Pseudomonadota bacterium]